MNKDDIIRMAREAGWPDSLVAPVIMDKLAEFAAIIASAEREACAKEAEDSDHVVRGWGYYDQLGDADATVRNIANAIRARGEASIRGQA